MKEFEPHSLVRDEGTVKLLLVIQKVVPDNYRLFKKPPERRLNPEDTALLESLRDMLQEIEACGLVRVNRKAETTNRRRGF